MVSDIMQNAMLYILMSLVDSEIDQTLKKLQKPAACNFILSMVER